MNASTYTKIKLTQAQLTEDIRSHSRGYTQGWLDREGPPRAVPRCWLCSISQMGAFYLWKFSKLQKFNLSISLYAYCISMKSLPDQTKSNDNEKRCLNKTQHTHTNTHNSKSMLSTFYRKLLMIYEGSVEGGQGPRDSKNMRI